MGSAYWFGLETPIGRVTLVEEEGAITQLRFGEFFRGTAVQEETPLLHESILQLEAYFQGKLRVFDLPLNPRGTAFQCNVR